LFHIIDFSLPRTGLALAARDNIAHSTARLISAQRRDYRPPGAANLSRLPRVSAAQGMPQRALRSHPCTIIAQQQTRRAQEKGALRKAYKPLLERISYSG
jgi:hypothetical protein